MPIPKPKSGEARDDFLTRCQAAVADEIDDKDKAAEACLLQWGKEESADKNKQLLDEVRTRFKQTRFNYGILTADRYVETLRDRIGSDACYRFAASRHASFEDVLRKAASTLVYANPDMVVEEIEFSKKAGYAPEQLDGIELPKNTLMVFRHVLTTPRKDRDGDILRTGGAKVDPKLPLLWQHVHTLPIGKMLRIVEHNSKKLSLISAIVDLNEVAHDAAVMIDNGMGRFSHGFRALSFDKVKGSREGNNERPDAGSFDVKEFEILEESLVTVPSNVDAETEDVLLSLIDGGKLTSGMMKEFGKELHANRPTSVGIKYRESVGDFSREIEAGNAADFKEVFGVTSKETDDENLSGDRSGEAGGEGQGNQDAPGTSEKADDGGNEDDGTKAPPNSQVEGFCPECGAKVKMPAFLKEYECKECGHKMKPDEVLDEKPKEEEEKKSVKVHGHLSGSYEDIFQKLQEKAGPHLIASGVDVSKEGYVSIQATFPKKAIITVEEWGQFSSEKHYEAAWQMKGKEPEFKGKPKEVDIEISTSIRNMKKVAKAGRALSKAVLGIIKGVYEDLEDLQEKGYDLNRGGLSIVKRCRDKMKDLIESVEGKPDGETLTEPTLKDCTAGFLAMANKEDRDAMLKILRGLSLVDAKRTTAKHFRALMGSNT